MAVFSLELLTVDGILVWVEFSCGGIEVSGDVVVSGWTTVTASSEQNKTLDENTYEYSLHLYLPFFITL